MGHTSESARHERAMSVLITGASSGIGRATAALLARMGHTVFDLSRSDKPQEGVRHIPCDVTDRRSVRRAVARAAELGGGVDRLILCAGMGVAGAVEFTRESEMLRQFDVNLYGPVRVLQEALPLMRAQPERRGERGRVVLVSSMAAVFGVPYQAMYSASKAALNSLAFSLSNELRGHAIRVCCVMPGDARTAFKRATDLSGSRAYPRMEGSIRAMERAERSGQSAEGVARAVARAATARRPPLYSTPDPVSRVECLAARLAPSRLALWVVARLYKS